MSSWHHHYPAWRWFTDVLKCRGRHEWAYHFTSYGQLPMRHCRRCQRTEYRDGGWPPDHPAAT